MAYDPKVLLDAVDTFMAACGYFDSTSVGPPYVAPDGRHGAVWLDGFEMTDIHGGVGSGRVTLIMRAYRRGVNEPNDQVEYEMGQMAFDLIERICGDLDFGDASVRNVDAAGISFSTDEVLILSEPYSTVDITIPLIVNDVVSWG